MITSKKDVFKNIRSILDFVYLIQKMRDYSVLSEQINSYTKKNQIKDQIIQFVDDFKCQKNNAIDVDFYLNILLSIDEKISNKDFLAFSKFTNLIINPLINEVIKNLSSEDDPQIEQYIYLIYLSEELSIKRGTISFFANKRNEIPINYILDITHRYGEFSKFILNITEINNFSVNKNTNTKHIHIKKCFDIFTHIINNFIDSEKIMLKDLFSYIEIKQKAIPLIEYKYNNNHTLLSNLSEREIFYLFQKGKLLSLKKNENISFIENTVYFCLKGKVKILKINIKGNESVIDLCKKKDIFFSKFFTKNTSIISLTNNTLFFIINEDSFTDIFNKNIKNLYDFFKYQENYIIRKNNQLETLNSHDAEERLALFLTENRISKSEENFDKASIAGFLNMRPETFSRTLKEITLNQSKNSKYLCSYCRKADKEPCYPNCSVKKY